MENQNDKNSKMNKDVGVSEDIKLKTKIFSFYYYVLRKKDINLILCCFLLILESLQLISYAFTEPHKKTWKLDMDKMDVLEIVIGATRITPLMKYVPFNLYIIIYAIIIVYIFVHSLILVMVIKFNKNTSKFYQLCVGFTRYFTPPLTIFLMVPFSELIVLPLKCENGYVSIVKEPEECWKSLHYLYVTLGLVFFIVFYGLIFFNSIFYFDLFNNKKTTTKIDTYSDNFFYVCKMIIVLKFVLIKNEYISIVILLILSLFNLRNGYSNPTYNNHVLESLMAIRNASSFWTFFVLLIGKLAEDSKINGIIYLLLFGYPLIITVSIIYYRKKNQIFIIASTNFNDSLSFLMRIKYMIKLVESFLNKNKNGKSNKQNACKKDEILLKGIIATHEETCVQEECPLKKFLDVNSSFANQKTCLLHYMNNLFTEGIKKFPNSRLLLMIFIQFNYDKKYNLNAAKTYLTKLEKQKNTLTEDYIIYSIKQNAVSSNNKMNLGLGDNEEMLKIEDTVEQKYKRLKVLIETTTKLFSEFWGILAANLTNNLNINKLFSIGNKLNKYLNEINTLWDNDLKNKKIDLENQSVAQLYSHFLREILKNKKRSDEITRKLNEEQHYESRKNDTEKIDMDNLDILLENQDCVIYCRTNEKGESNIIQCSVSTVYLLGFSKQELIGKNIEELMPSDFIKDHKKMLSKTVKSSRVNNNSHKDNFRANDKKQIFILPHTKVGYLIPISCRFTINNDDDFANTYLIKAKFEPKDTKSVYAFYVLTNKDLKIDSITSSAINLGLTMDLLKNQMLYINLLIRGEDEEEIDFLEKYNEYSEEPKKVLWIKPNYLYSNNEKNESNNENINDKIKKAPKIPYLLLITKMKYENIGDDAIGYVFKFTKIDEKKNVAESSQFFQDNSKMILFDLLRLNYVRSKIVDKKSDNCKHYNQQSSLINLLDGGFKQNQSNNKKEGEKKKKRKERQGDFEKNEDQNENSNEGEEEKKKENPLTVEKIKEYTSANSDEIKAFIFELPFFGENVTLEKHRPNRERYPVGRAQEPEVKISISNYLKRVDDRIKAGFDKKHGKLNENVLGGLESASTTGMESSGFTSEFETDSSAALSNIFNEKSVFYIKIFSISVFLLICGIISAEFSISLSKINDSKDRVEYMNKGFHILNSLVYTKFFLTETIICQNQYNNQTENYTNMDGDDVQTYAEEMMSEMASYRDTFSNMYSHYSNSTVKFSKEYQNYIKTRLVQIKTLSNGNETQEYQPFDTAMNRIPTSIFYVSRVIGSYNNINMSDRNAYELMMNLLNDYLLAWRNVTFLLVDDVKMHTKGGVALTLIFIFSFIVAVASLFGLWKFIIRFMNDREKPIDLFLTIKKTIFEDLKSSSENFINKLLNKFFGNAENEEESMIDCSTNIKPDDINIIKFKTKNEYKQSIRTSGEHMMNYIKVCIFFIIIQAYMIFKFCYNKNSLKNMNNFTDVFNKTHYCQSDIITGVDVIKSYFYNTSIEIYNEKKNNTHNIFINNFISLSYSLESLLEVSYNTTSFLKDKYSTELYKSLNSGISSQITSSEINPTTDFKGTLNNGFKAVLARYFELLRFVSLDCIKIINTYNTKTGLISDDLFRDYLNRNEFSEINKILRFVIRPWFNNIILNINGKFSDYANMVKLVNVTTFIVLLIGIILLYCLVWKSYEENLKDLLKTAVDLLNLIPEEIKYQIVQKLNDEDNKKE